MSDVAEKLETALAQASQELGAIQRVGRALTPAEVQRVETLQQVEAQLQQALDALRSLAETTAVEPAAENAPVPADAGPVDAAGAGEAGADAAVEQAGLGGVAGGAAGPAWPAETAGGSIGGSATGSVAGERFDPRGSEMMSDGLAGADDTDDY